MPLLFILEDWGWVELIIAGIVGFFAVIYALKYALPTQLAKTTSELLEKRTTERDDALRERDAYKEEVKTLKEEMKTLQRENFQRAEISREDTDTIRELRAQIKAQGV
jgi:hypothetical protein